MTGNFSLEISIVNFVFLGAGHFYFPINIFELCSGTQVKDLGPILFRFCVQALLEGTGAVFNHN
jgi:hypothetical protein